MKQDKQFRAEKVGHDALSARTAEAMETRTKAVVAALRVALDKVYDEDGAQQVRRMARDYKDWAGEPVPERAPPGKEHK